MAYRPVNETDIATLVLTILVNVIVTALLSLKLQKAQRNAASTLLSGNSMYLGVIAILVESAAPMAITGIGLVIAPLVPTIEGWKAATIFDIFFKNFAVRSLSLGIHLTQRRATTARFWPLNSSSFVCRRGSHGQAEPILALGSRANYDLLDLLSHRSCNQFRMLRAPRFARWPWDMRPLVLG